MSIKFTYVGHATYILEIEGQTIVVDPFFTSNPLATIKAENVAADVILQSHGHFDHIEDTVALAQRTGAKVIANWEIGSWLQSKGLTNVHQQNIGGGFNHEFGHVKLTIAHHSSGLPDGNYGGNPAGFIITAAGKKIYLACDTALFYEMQLYGEEGIDLCVLPIGDNFTMGPADALRAVQFIKPKLVVPCHYNTWPPIAQDGQTWAKRVESETESKAEALGPGDWIEI